MFKAWKTAALILAAVMCCAPLAQAEPAQDWELINPSGEIERFAIAPAGRLDSLDGKNIVLRWNGKHNGNIALDHLATLLAKQVPTATIVKSYELDTSLNTVSGNVNESKRITDYLVGLKPDIVIAFQAD